MFQFFKTNEKEWIHMGRSWLIPISLAIFALVLWLTTFLYPSIQLTRVISTLIIILIIYIIFKLVFEDNFISKVLVF